jgi:AhpD family alkylhydroperoxidase
MSREAHEGRSRENTVGLVDEDEATGPVAEVYREIRAERDGELDEELGLSKLWLLYGNDPELLEIVWQHMHWTYNGGSLPFELKSKISLVVASVLECEGCRYFHESALEECDVEAEAIEALEAGTVAEYGFSPTEELILRFSQKAAQDPHAITDDDLAALRDLGLDEQQLLELTDCIAMHVYTAYIQGIAGIVYPGMSRDEWTSPLN